MTDLKGENAKLKRTVRSLLARIEENHRIDQHFQQFEFDLLGSSRLHDVLDKLLQSTRDHFRLADVGLYLVDRDFAIETLLEALEIDRYENRLQLRNSDDFALTLYAGQRRVKLGVLDPLAASRLFPNLPEVGSAALLPLTRNGRMIGSLHFASLDKGRFSEEKAVDFMHHLSCIVALCLENSLQREHLKRQSRVDMLTQVSNRMNFEAEFAKELERSERSDDPLSCIFVDVDHFKKTNDEFGHQAGDLCLKSVAQTIKQELRKTDLLARYGGEEFVVLLNRCEQQEASIIAERIRIKVAELAIDIDGGRKMCPTVSLGLVTWQPVGERTPNLAKLGQRLLSTADDAMYEAKRKGRNCVVIKPFAQMLRSAGNTRP